MNHNQNQVGRREFVAGLSSTLAGTALGTFSTGDLARAAHAKQPKDSLGSTDESPDNSSLERHFEPATERTAAIARYEGYRMGMFIHFTMSSFLDGHFWQSFNGPLPSAKNYAPTDLDVEQWIRSAASAEMKYAVLTAHHQMGFALWDSKYTEFDVANGSNKTDVVAEYVKACKKHGVAPGLFYALGMDGAHRRDMKMTEEQWCNHARNQIRELLTNYGPIPILWFDALPRISLTQLQKTYDMVKSLQPDCLVVGNHGYGANGRRLRYFPVDVIAGERSFAAPDGHDPRVNVDGKTYYIPMVTCDTLAVGTRSKGWFWEPGEQLKEVQRELLQLYSNTRRRKTNLLLNVSPNREGRLPDATVKRLIEFGEAIRREKRQ